MILSYLNKLEITTFQVQQSVCILLRQNHSVLEQEGKRKNHQDVPISVYLNSN